MRRPVRAVAALVILVLVFRFEDADAALALVSEAAEAIRKLEEQSAQAVARAHSAANAVMERIKSSMRRVNIFHDVFFLENSLYEDKSVWETVEELRKRGYVYEKDGAVWFKSTALGDEKDRVIVKTTGDPTYRPVLLEHRYERLPKGDAKPLFTAPECEFSRPVL